MQFIYLVFTRMPGASYRRRLRSLLLYLCYEDVLLVETMYLVHAFQVRVTAGDSGLCCRTCVTYFEL